ncbi:MAG: hypothetical protein QXO85_02010, partial [Sulfolobales archaeon]
RMWGFPHSNELELDEGELWVGVTLNGLRTMMWAPMKRYPEDDEAKGRDQTTSTNMKPKPPQLLYNLLY